MLVLVSFSLARASEDLANDVEHAGASPRSQDAEHLPALQRPGGVGAFRAGRGGGGRDLAFAFSVLFWVWKWRWVKFAL